ncbi:MAG: methyltransferase domain-containing protein [Roseibacillus sp.]|jgi:FkbM family methyltransferase
MKPLLVTVAIAGLGSAAFGWWVIDNYSSEKQSRKILAEEAGNEAEENADAPEPEPGPETKTKPQPKPESKPEPGPAANTVPPKPKEDIYSQGRKTFDGTGKYYMGREIAYVMGHQAIRWLERADREKEEAPSKAIAALNLKPTDVIADIGAGSGYYTFRLAPLVPNGKVIAVDIQPEMIEFLEKKEKKLGITNVEAHLGMVDDTKLKPESIDAALMVDAYHEFSHPREMMESLFKALKPGGRIVLLEYRAEDPTVPIKPLHKMTEAQSRKEMEVVGLKWKSTDSKLLPWQHFMVFVKP